PAFASAKPSGYSEQYSSAKLIRKTIATAGLPHTFLTNVQNFQREAALWVTIVLMSGFFERHPKINAAVFEASSTWLSFLIDECETLLAGSRKAELARKRKFAPDFCGELAASFGSAGLAVPLLTHNPGSARC